MNETDAPGDQAEDTIALTASTGLTESQETVVGQRILQEQLAEAGVHMSLGALQAATLEQRVEACAWIEAYLLDPKACTIDRPGWLPAPDAAA